MRFGNEIVEIRLEGAKILFRNSTFGNEFAPMEFIRLDKGGTLKEFPDLEGREDWATEAVIRFKAKLKSMKSDIERANYVIEDLKKYGYIPVAMQKEGHRVVRLE